VTEVFYPTLDEVQTLQLEFLVGDSQQTFVDEQRLGPYTSTRPDPRSMRWRTTAGNPDHGWRLSEDLFTDPGRDALVARVRFEALGGRQLSDFHVYLFHDPALANAGAGDSSRTLTFAGRQLLAASEGNRASALGVSRPWARLNGVPMLSNGFVGVSDGLSDLLGKNPDFGMEWSYPVAGPGNVAQLGWIDLGSEPGAASVSFDVVLGFGESEAEASQTTLGVLDSDLEALQASYDAGWHSYADSLDSQGGSADDAYYLAAMSLQTVQDKSNGAMIAAFGTPWGEEKPEDPPAPDKNGGYHLVWSRDLFKFANALITAGDLRTARSAVSYLFGTLQQSKDCGEQEEGPKTSDCPEGYSRVGRFPQNARVDGFPNWNKTQLDEQAMPILLAYRVYEHGDQATQREILALWPKLRASAEYILSLAPWTQQERWEESSGYSPSTIAAEIAGLVTAAEFARLAGDLGAAGRYLSAADYFQQNVTRWTFTTTGPLGNGAYFIRLNPAARNDGGSGLERFDPEHGPDEPTVLELGNGSGPHDQREVVDGGFLELVRLGVKAANDPAVLETLPEYDATLKQTIAGRGEAWFRYDFDGYGERNDGAAYDNQSGRGRLWPIFTAERGMYEIQRSCCGDTPRSEGAGASGVPYLAALRAFATPEGFIPEQIWNASTNLRGFEILTPPGREPGTPTGSVAPLSWAMGEYISLLASIRAGTIADMPSLVCARYDNCARDAPGRVLAMLSVTASADIGDQLYVTGGDPALGNWHPQLGLPVASLGPGRWRRRVNLPAGQDIEYAYYLRRPDGSISFKRPPATGRRRLKTNQALTWADIVSW
jgi:glucoamylase